MPKKCKGFNCRNDAVVHELHWAKDDYCRECVVKTEESADAMSCDYRSNKISRINNSGTMTKIDRGGQFDFGREEP